MPYFFEKSSGIKPAVWCNSLKVALVDEAEVDVQNHPLVPRSSKVDAVFLLPPGSPAKPVVFVPLYAPHSVEFALRELAEFEAKVVYSAAVGI
jgi:hypothetical protein